VLPIALRMVMEIATVVRDEFPGRSISGIGGVETGEDAAQFILLGADTVQVCTGVMKHGYGLIHALNESLLAFMEKHKFERLEDFRGHSVQFFTTHADLVKRQAEARAAAKAKADAKRMIQADDQWTGEQFVEQSDALARG
jgi:dihydropyrimidine dehydrogenase (NADP+)/dihydropyrimidine dehydrogenase (NAD+) subunit PreA